MEGSLIVLLLESCLKWWILVCQRVNMLIVFVDDGLSMVLGVSCIDLQELIVLIYHLDLLSLE